MEVVLSGRTLTPLAHPTPQKLENFQKSNLGVRILLSRLQDFRKANERTTVTRSLLRPIWLELEHL